MFTSLSTESVDKASKPSSFDALRDKLPDHRILDLALCADRIKLLRQLR